MKKIISLLSVGVVLITLSACHQKPIKSVVTSVIKSEKQKVSSLELLPLSEHPRTGRNEIELIGRKWYADSENILTRNELASLSFVRNYKGNEFLQILPNKQGQNKIYNALRNKDNYILMILDGRAISLSELNSQKVLPFYVGDSNATIKVAEDITQKTLSGK
ncbi:Uncharacterised protein [Salmonella enterica subsp. indica]|uniref:Lipoprotein n=1 Tax=Salmonella enterica subsp. indica TaxID=59207 RepID=A0A379YLX9_SALER|nr:hypothetical protein [Salmonella enterica]SUI47008.1 Uncharacterised protein [Salmonella enterica subsp. indica]